MTVNMSGWITDANTGAFVANGTAGTPPAGQNWDFKFSGLNVNVAYVLNIKASAADGTVTTAQENFTCTSP
jgi:hypothetical protein